MKKRTDAFLTSLLLTALAFQGLSGLSGGIALIVDPTGDAIGIPIEWLSESSFGSYLIPGLILLTVLGIAPLVVALSVWGRRRWSIAAALAVGAGLLIWIAVEVAIIGYQPSPPLQLIYGLLGGIILGLSLVVMAVRRDGVPTDISRQPAAQ